MPKSASSPTKASSARSKGPMAAASSTSSGGAPTVAEMISFVQALDSHTSGKLAKKKGKRILRTTARNNYNLDTSQLECLQPISEAKNPHDKTSTMKYYNECDAKALSEFIYGPNASSSSPSASPSKAKASPRKPRYRHYHEDEPYYNVFDGMSSDDAAFAMAGIIAYSNSGGRRR